MDKFRKKINITKVFNNDWEEIAQDSLYLYIGDFGNNLNGNRSNLHILRIEKKSFLLHDPIVDTIAFSYSNQTDFTKKNYNTTDFDCEAFIVSSDSIYLFTKQWTNNNTAIYVLPKIPGNYKANFKETIAINGLVTAATTNLSRTAIVLCGYSKTLKPFIYLISDYKNNNFSKANKRKLLLSLPFHQTEGIATIDGLLYYITNEAFIRKPLVNSPQKIISIDLSPYLKP